MCFRDFVRALAAEGVRVTDTQVRWAIASGKIPRPPMDGSLRYVFSTEHVQKAKQIFGRKQAAGV